MKSSSKMTHVLLATGVILIFVFTLISDLLAGSMTFTDRAAFEIATDGLEDQSENFDSYSNGQPATQLFSGLVTFPSPLPTIYFGNWNSHGTGGQFSGGALIPEPRFASKSLIIDFASPVFGIGGNAFDDFDGTPLINVITLSVTTVLGTELSISETFPNVGNTGFLGAISSEGIIRAVFSIDGSGGNLEVDLLTVVPGSPPVEPTVTITAPDPIASEAGLSTGAFKITRTGDTDAPLIVQYTPTGTATPGKDYNKLSGAVLIPSGKSSATILLKPKADKLKEANETVIINLKGSGDYEIGTPNNATVTITDGN